MPLNLNCPLVPLKSNDAFSTLPRVCPLSEGKSPPLAGVKHDLRGVDERGPGVGACQHALWNLAASRDNDKTGCGLTFIYRPRSRPIRPRPGYIDRPRGGGPVVQQLHLLVKRCLCSTVITILCHLETSWSSWSWAWQSFSRSNLWRFIWFAYMS